MSDKPKKAEAGATLGTPQKAHDSETRRQQRLKMAKETEDGSRRFTAQYLGFAIGGIAMAYFAQPVLRFIEPAWQASFGFMLAVAIISTHALYADPTPSKAKRVDRIARTISISLGFAAVTFFAFVGYDRAATNQKRCDAIERAMLAPMPTRPDLPDLFSALDCRTHLRDEVQFPAAPAAPRAPPTPAGR